MADESQHDSSSAKEPAIAPESSRMGTTPASGPVQPYEVVPEGPRPVRPLPVPMLPALSSPTSAGGASPGKVERPGVLEGFDEDADFDFDPEVQRAQGQRPPTAARSSPSLAQPVVAIPMMMVTPGRGELKPVAIVGGVIALVAAVAAGFTAAPGSNRFLIALSALFDVALHTVTGVGAVGIAAALLGKVLRNTELAAARMLVATALFAFGFQLDFNSPGHTLGLGIAAGSYFLAVWFLFKLKAEQAFIIGACHFAMWILFFLHHYLATLAAPVAKAIPAVGG